MDEHLLQTIGIVFQDELLLKSAFIHRSYLHEHPERTEGLPSNERLEFLGDSVLNFLTASWLYERFPAQTEGKLTALRAALVKTTTLARFARELRLGNYVRISRGEDSPAARDRPPLLADVFEALLGAIYLDQGLDTARSFVMPFLERELERILAGQVDIDYRTRLQEEVQALYGITPTYSLVDVTGPDHCREFTIQVMLSGDCLGQGNGRSKQQAAQNAARAALEVLHNGSSEHA
ncbi:MAG: ribonuclease III [Chloroflexales bacterium]|nr:ribonuclease III [Chloroflexales bacterium]